jgi:hypothetical protein
MHEQPPGAASRFLQWALGSSEEARAVLGDLNEDFTAFLRREGRGPARRWYWTQSIALAFSALGWRVLGRPIVRNTKKGDGTMGKTLSTSGLLQDTTYALRSSA